MLGYGTLARLIVVPGHAVYAGQASSDTLLDEKWVGRFGYSNESSLYVEQARAGVIRAGRDEEALLVFSGGQTRREAGPRSEAVSYVDAVEQNDWFGYPNVAKRTTVEEFARDSFENLEFSILLFTHLTQREPTKVEVCGFGFKQKRFTFHAMILGITDFQYVSVNDPPNDVLQSIALPSEERTLKLFRANPRGDTGELLSKRLERDPYDRGNPYYRAI